MARSRRKLVIPFSDRKFAMPRNPVAQALATLAGKGQGAHKAKENGKGTRKQRRERAIEGYC